MPKRVWRSLHEVAAYLPGRLPLMVAPRGVNRAPLPPQEANNEGHNGALAVPGNVNDFPHPDPPAPVEVVTEIAEEDSILQKKFDAVEKKIIEAVGSDDSTTKKLQKLRNEMKYLKKVASELSEQ